MRDYPVHITSEITEEKLKEGLFIFVFRASRIPPHLGIITNGKLYDISTVGPNLDLPVSDFYGTILKRKTEVIFIELDKSNVNFDLRSLIAEKVKKYWKVSPSVSCLNPIKDFLCEVYKLAAISKTNFIFELLPVLYENKLITEVSQLNLDNKITNNTFKLTRYTEKDIEKCIDALERKRKNVC